MKLPDAKMLAAGAVGAAAALALAALWGARPGRRSETAVYTLAVPAGTAPAPAVPAAAPSPGAAALPAAHRADVLFESGRFAEALPVYRQAVAEDPKDADSWMDLGLTLAQLGRAEEAIEPLTAATRIQPGYQRAWLSLGFVLRGAGRVDEARAALSKAVAIDPASGLAQEAKSMLAGL